MRSGGFVPNKPLTKNSTQFTSGCLRVLLELGLLLSGNVIEPHWATNLKGRFQRLLDIGKLLARQIRKAFKITGPALFRINSAIISAWTVLHCKLGWGASPPVAPSGPRDRVAKRGAI